MKVIFSSSALVASMLIAASVNATPFDGLYKSVHGTWTCTPEDIGLDGGSLGIQSNFLYGLESECELKNPTKVRGMDAVLYDTESKSTRNDYDSAIRCTEQLQHTLGEAKNASMECTHTPVGFQVALSI